MSERFSNWKRMARVYGFKTPSSATGTSMSATRVNQITPRIVCRPIRSVAASSTFSNGSRRSFWRPTSQTVRKARR